MNISCLFKWSCFEYFTAYFARFPAIIRFVVFCLGKFRKANR